MRKTLLILTLGLFFLVQTGGICWSQTTERVSVSSVGGDSNGASNLPSISSDGRYVAFESEAGNLVAGDTAFPSGFPDIFVHNLQTRTTTWVSEDSLGGEGDGPSFHPSISSDGRYVAFTSDASNLVDDDTNGRTDIFVYEGDPLPPNTTQSEENNSGGSGSCFIATAASDWADF